MGMHELLTIREMYAADEAAVEGGIASHTLMEIAGRAAADQIRARWASRPVSILCGPGNNGGDGFVIARHLDEAGWPVSLYLAGDKENLPHDAALQAERWQGAIEPLSPKAVDRAELVVDALFGAGLTRPLEGAALATINRISESGVPCVAIDVPSGVQGDTGLVLGAAACAELTITFFRRKPGHLLMPGSAHCGSVVTADIGIPDTVLDGIAPQISANHPDLWQDQFVWPEFHHHKYTRGHGLIVGGSEMSGAARLASMAARRIGAGLITVAVPPKLQHLYTAEQPGLLTLPFQTPDDFSAILKDNRKSGILVGPGSGINQTTHDIVLAAAKVGRRIVLDADALTVFQENPDELFRAITGSECVLTPHEGEFSRLFRFNGDKLTRARKAAELCGAVVLLKGSDTVIASPDGRAFINENAPPTLSTAGTGDVLAGTILGLLVQGMPALEAACAGVWLNAKAAATFGYGLIAEDLPGQLPRALHGLRQLTDST